MRLTLLNLLTAVLLPLLSVAQVRYAQTAAELTLYTEDPEHPLLVLPLEKPFIEVARADLKVKSKMGSFKLREKPREVYTFQQLDGISQDEQGDLRIKCLMKSARKRIRITLQAKLLDDGHLRLHIRAPGGRVNHITFRYKESKDSRLFGFGEQFSHLDMQNRRVPLVAEENGIGRGDKRVTGLANLGGAGGGEFSTYCPIPFYMSTENRGIFVATGNPLYFDFTDRYYAEATFRDFQVVLEIWKRDNPLDILEDYTQLSGRFRQLPDWAWGTWLGMQGGPDKVRAAVQQAQAAGNPVTAVWIQDWVGKRKTVYGSRLNWNWEADRESYENLKEFIGEMNAIGVQVLGYVNPFWSTESKYIKKLAKRHYLVENDDREALKIPVGGFKAYQMDLLNPKARTWMAEHISKQMIDLGFSGWMADFGEWYPAKARRRGDRGWLEAHNLYPVYWQQVNRMAVDSHPRRDELLFFSRSGYAYGGTFASVYWTGDQTTSWGRHDGLPSAVTALLSSGLSGIAINHSDIGGYTNVSLPGLKLHRDKALFFRWAELAAFTPIFRTHEGLQPDKNVQPWTDSTTVAFFTRMGRLHHALKPYFKHLNAEAAEKGYPIIRHLWLHYPEDRLAAKAAEQFLLGEDLLVLPVLAPGKASVHGYFPPGEWEHLWTGEVVKGERYHEVRAPLGQPAAYVRVGGAWAARLRAAVEPLRLANMP